jgi:hypothetical protein
MMPKRFNYLEVKENILKNRTPITRSIFTIERNIKKGFTEALDSLGNNFPENLNYLSIYDDVAGAVILNVAKHVNQKDDTGSSPAAIHAIRSAFSYSFITNNFSRKPIEEQRETVVNILLHDFVAKPNWEKDLTLANSYINCKISPNKLIVREPILDYSNVPTEERYIVQTYAYIRLAEQCNSPIFYDALVADINDTLLGPIFFSERYLREYIYPMAVNFYFIIKQLEMKADTSMVEMFYNLFNEICNTYDIKYSEFDKKLRTVEDKKETYEGTAIELLNKWQREINYPVL